MPKLYTVCETIQYHYVLQVVALRCVHAVIIVLFVFLHSELSGKELVAELVYSFLMPEVEKKTMREKGECVGTIVILLYLYIHCRHC